MGTFRDLSGQQFGRWTAIAESTRDRAGNVMWRCKCECGVVRDVSSNSLRNGKSKSCGCWNSEKARARLTTLVTKHGLTLHPLYTVWNDMKARCFNRKDRSYPRYGGRGITVCNEWRNEFQTFYNWATVNGYARGLQIDRIDNEGNYEPCNCRWATRSENGRNKRNNRIIEFNGKAVCLSEWGEMTGLTAETIHKRIKRGWPLDRVLRLPEGSLILKEESL